jgi:hypothetical protein
LENVASSATEPKDESVVLASTIDVLACNALDAEADTLSDPSVFDTVACPVHDTVDEPVAPASVIDANASIFTEPDAARVSDDSTTVTVAPSVADTVADTVSELDTREPASASIFTLEVDAT